ncbi:hypothetical protein D9M72_554830 [compost metagenome]
MPPALQQLSQFDSGRQIRRLAHFAMGQVVEPPDRPLQLVVGRRRQLPRVHARGRNAVVEPEPHRHDDLAADSTAAERVALRGADEKRYPDLLPVVGDELQHVRLECAFAGRFHDDLRGPAIGQDANAVTIALRQARFVE